MKVIQILTHSLSPLKHLTSSEQLITGGWHTTLAKKIIEFSDFEMECWRPELNLKKNYTTERDGIVYRIFPSFGAMGREVSLPLLKALKTEVKRGPLLIHLHCIFTWLTYMIVAFFGGRVPVVAQHHGEEPAIKLFSKMLTEGSPRSLGYLTLGFLEQLTIPLLKKVDFFFALNRAMKAYLSKVVGDDGVTIGTMGVDFEKFKPGDMAEARKRLGLSDNENKKYILYVGSLLKVKGLENLIHTFHRILKTYSEVYLLLIGQGNYRGRLEALCKTLGIMDKVLFTGWVENNRLPDFYNAADVCVLPSLREGLGLVVVEALACGRPFIGSNVGGIPEVVGNFEAGLLVPPQDGEALTIALLKTFSNNSPPKMKRLKAEKCYDWKYISTNILRIYESLFQKYYGTKDA